MKRFKELGKYAELNPIRDHISLHFKLTEEGEELSWIFKNIESTFKVNISRVIVFCFSRKSTENSALRCNEYFSKHESLKSKAAFYHAGMDSESRNRTFKGYNDGKYQILFATKAFGMGMDIKNIHHVFHLEPSSSFEDYLQEVGRAGRNSKMLIEAGFSVENPINAICVYNVDSFSSKVDQIQKSQFSWNDMCNAFEVYKDFRRKFISQDSSKDIETYLPVPMNLIGISNIYQGSSIDQASLFRLSLYWLEKSARISSRYNVPAYLEFKNDPFFTIDISNNIKDDAHKSIFKHIFNLKEKSFKNEESTLVESNELMKAASVDMRDLLFKTILNMQERGYLELINKVKLELTEGGKNEISRLIYVKSRFGKDCFYQFIKGMETIGHRIIDSISPYDETVFDLDYLTSISREIQQEIFLDEFFSSIKLEQDYVPQITEYLTKNQDSWDNKVKSTLSKLRQENSELNLILQKQRTILIDDEFTNKLKSIFQLLGTHPGVKITSKFSEETDHIIQSVSISESKTKIKNYLTKLTKDASELLTVLSGWESRVVNVNQLILSLNISERSYSYLETLILTLKKLGYLKMFGGLIPMAIEMKFDNLEPLNNLEGDLEVKENFIETIRLKKLRLCALNAFSDIQDKSMQSQFIQDYFKSAQSTEIIELIEQSCTSEKAEEILRSYRADALDLMVNGEIGNNNNPGLNEEQKAIYDADIRKNLSVIAGPGTGKTHTLVLRVARLIQEEAVSPAAILVLAYNRSVAEELRIRLKELFTKLGYKSLIDSLQIYTFHGLMGAILKKNGVDVELSKWEDEFIKLYKKNGRRCLRKFENVQYVFVDEFQDITKKRLDILKFIAPNERVFLTVIGDPNQSIYGYEKVDQGGSRSPEPYYSEFDNTYEPDHKFLITNYRSTNQIIEASKKVLGDQLGNLKIEPFKKDIDGSVQTLSSQEDWLNPLISILLKEDINETAVLYRTNEELYKDFYKLKYLCECLEINIIINGSSSQFVKTREVSRILEVLIDNRGGEEIDKDFIKEKVIKAVKSNYPKWNFELIDNLHLLFEHFFDQYGSRSTYTEFAEFVKEITQRDDGQLFNVLKKKKGINRKTLIMTTIHRVKGLEYDAVIVPTSIAILPFDKKEKVLSECELQESFDEEKRLLYVAYSRAKKYLIYQEGDREQALKSYDTFQAIEAIDKLGIPVKNEMGQIKISWKASEKNHSNTHDLIHNQLIIGDELALKKDQWGNLSLIAKNQILEQFTDKVSRKFDMHEYMGVFLDSVIRYSFEESKIYDEKNKTSFSNSWCEKARENGFIYLVSFYGYAQEKNSWSKERTQIKEFIDNVLKNIDNSFEKV